MLRHFLYISVYFLQIGTKLLVVFLMNYSNSFVQICSFVILFVSSQSQNELKPLDHCEFAYQLKKDEICINPYHYKKVELSILVPKSLPTPPDSLTDYPLDDHSNQIPHNIQFNNGLK